LKSREAIVKAFIFERNGEPAYGHTAGLTAYILENGGEKVMFWGDVVNIALQVDNPDISLRFDSAAAAAAVTLNVDKTTLTDIVRFRRGNANGRIK
jgi:glyoxylase-like metal-dependent hydrolase (beta-lactamase superfamily II)